MSVIGDRPGRQRRLRRGTVLAALALLAISACTSADVLRPEVDIGAQTASTAPQLARPIDPAPQYSEPEPQISLAEPALSEPDPGPLPETDTALADPPPDEFGSRSLAADEEIGLGRAAVEEPSVDEPRPARPDPVLAGYPRVEEPAFAPAMPSEELSCRKQLKKLRVAFTERDPINQGGACRIDHPIKVSKIGNVTIKPAATLNCEMAEAFALWTRNELVPASRWRFLSAVKTIHQGSSYSCRNIAGTRTSSEHARGNAIDIMKLELGNGKVIDVRKPGLFAFRKRGLLNTVRADGCQYFTTVLGPGYNADHANHFHFDIKSRRNGYRACR